MPESRAHIRTHNTWIVFMDFLCLLVGCILGIGLRLGYAELGEYVFYHVDGWLMFGTSVILANYLSGSYRLQHVYSRFDVVVTWLFSISVAFIVLSITSYAWFHLVLGRGVLALAIAFYSVLSLALRMALFRSIFRSPYFTCRTAILGAGSAADDVRHVIEEDYVLPIHRVVATLNVGGSPDGPAVATHEGVAVLAVNQDNLEEIVRSLNLNLLVVALPDMTRAVPFYPQLRRLRFEGVELLSALNVQELYKGRTPVALLSQEAMMEASLQSGAPLVGGAKRIMDVLVAGLGIVLFFPVGLLVALLLKLAEPGSPVFYMQERVGLFGRTFRIWKFRTMRVDAERGTGAVWAQADDPRVTWLGRILRRYRLDEFPQLLNVLAGDMSIVGPRPERPEICAELERAIPYYAERKNVIPGLTGWAQIKYPYGSTVDDARRKLEYDLYYIKCLSIRLDVQIILSTLRIVILGKERER